MADEGKGLGLVILGIVAVIAVVGLVLMFMGAKGTGKVALSNPGVFGEADPQIWSDYYRSGKQAPPRAAEELWDNEQTNKPLKSTDVAFHADDLRGETWTED